MIIGLRSTASPGKILCELAVLYFMTTMSGKISWLLVEKRRMVGPGLSFLGRLLLEMPRTETLVLLSGFCGYVGDY